ncbi:MULTISPECIES: hypothetical protein [Hydrocarboniphaga]|uniref:hypothetical protein n=1 Tax=Hydrocarboniphaga TaxID=243627 RepID=UPI00058FC4E5|nr:MULTISPECIES: hypothetical protein [Hydrocarboniphaga]MDZ4077194.1 hypothetical protein [Hydrocarboniphaga sp.]
MITKAPTKAAPERPTNVLVNDYAPDTLTACSHVLCFLEEAVTNPDIADDMAANRQTIGDGARWIFIMVRDALEYEAARAALKGIAK